MRSFDIYEVQDPALWHSHNYRMKRFIFCRMNRVLLAAILLSVAASGYSQTSNTTETKHAALYAPRPEYPLAARQRHWTGAGLFACNIRPEGTVTSVDVLRSTGHQMLDQAAITALRQWRFQQGNVKLVKVPLSFWMNGSGVRHRMSGAVISD